MVLCESMMVGVGPAALVLIVISGLAGFFFSGCGPAPPAKWTSFREASPDPKEGR